MGNWEAEPLEACDLPGYKYPSDHFAHMAVFEERDVTPEVAITEEMYHLVKRDQVTPCYDQAVYEDSGKLVRMDYRFYFPECPEAADILAFLPNDPEVAEKRATVFETFKKYRPYRNMGEVEFNQRFNVDAFTAAKQADTVDYNMYCEKVTDQALRMNKHNQLRVDMEKEDAIYRTYTILKHFILCAGGKAKLADATPEELIKQASAKCSTCGGSGKKEDGEKCDTCAGNKKTPFGCTNGHQKLYKKFNKLPITLAEVKKNIKAAKEMWVTKFVRKTVLKGGIALGREEWADRNYALSESDAELASMPMKVLLGAFADVQGDLSM